MTTDVELANRVVALGIGRRFPCEHEWWIYQIAPPTDQVRESGKAEWFVRDWRVAGALMEKWPDVEIWRMPCKDMCMFHCGTDVDFNGCRVGICSNESLPRAIIEACVAALEQGSE